MSTERFPIDDNLTVWDFTCPRAFIPLSVGTSTNTRYTVRFLCDSGAAVSLFPTQLAERFHIPFDRSEPTAETDCPRTPLGRLPGFRGHLDVRLLDVSFLLPCHFYEYVPPAHPGGPLARPGTLGVAAERIRLHRPETLDEYIQMVEGRGNSRPPPAPPASVPRSSVVLGRLGFTSRFSVLFDARDQGRFVEVSNEPPKKRRR